jgi:hypothetical protein
MFTVEVEGVEYQVDFYHDETKHGRQTECVITSSVYPIRIGVARCSPEDRFNRAVGRQLSLRRALWFEYKVLAYFPVSVRTAIYHKYFSMTKPVTIRED